MILITASILLSGCAGAGDYLVKRGLDLSDALQFEVVGPGVGAYVEVTPLVHLGADVIMAYGDYGGACGNFQSRVPGASEFAAYSLIVFHARGVDTDPVSLDPNSDEDFPPPHGGFFIHGYRIGSAFSDDAMTPRYVRPIHWLDVEVDGAAFLGMRIGFSVGELGDFFLGWFGVDIAGDDAMSDGVTPRATHHVENEEQRELK